MEKYRPRDLFLVDALGPAIALGFLAIFENFYPFRCSGTVFDCLGPQVGHGLELLKWMAIIWLGLEIIAVIIGVRAMKRGAKYAKSATIVAAVLLAIPAVYLLLIIFAFLNR